MSTKKKEVAAPESEVKARRTRRNKPQMLVEHIASLSVDDLCDVFYEVGGTRSRAAALMVSSLEEGMRDMNDGSFNSRLMEPEETTPPLPFEKDAD